MSDWKSKAKELAGKGSSWREISRVLYVPKSTVSDYLRKVFKTEGSYEEVKTFPKCLFLDIETAPVVGAVWSLWKQNVGLNQIVTDWFILSYSAKWLGAPEEETLYEDLRGYVADENDSTLLDSLWYLLDEADIVITQNGKKFDTKKVNARFVMNGYNPPSSYKQIDTLEIAKRAFAFTSNKLQYMTDKLCTKYKKLPHGKFPGFYLWKECLADNIEAWEEMEVYNKYDVLSLEELYLKLAAWDNKHPNFNLYTEEEVTTCRCGSNDIIKYGFHYTQVSKFQRYRCKSCGAESRSRTNLFTKEKRQSLTMNVAN